MKSLIPFLLLALAGCGAAPQAYVPTPTAKVEPISTDVASAAALMPMAVGSRWTYAMRTERFKNGAPVGTENATAVYRVDGRQGQRLHPRAGDGRQEARRHGLARDRRRAVPAHHGP